MTRPTPRRKTPLNSRSSRQTSSSPRSVLTTEDRRRIEEEETFRAQVRAKVDAQQAKANAPSYWTGFVLNLLVIGLGFFVIGEVAWGAVWLIAAVVVNLNTAFIAWPFFAIGVLIHYRTLYVRKYK